jgi:hypothetical protein
MIRYDLTSISPPDRRDVVIFQVKTYAGDADHYETIEFEVRGEAHVARNVAELVAAKAIFPHGRGGCRECFEYRTYIGERLREELEADPRVGDEGSVIRRAAEVFDRGGWRWVAELPWHEDGEQEYSLDRTGTLKLTRYDAAGQAFEMTLNASDVDYLQTQVGLARQKMVAAAGGNYSTPPLEARAEFLLALEALVTA